MATIKAAAQTSVGGLKALEEQVKEMELKARLAELQAQYNEAVLRRDIARLELDKVGKV
jgi:hypothetical protein